MTLHRYIERLILVGSPKIRHSMPQKVDAPRELIPLVEGSRTAQRHFNQCAATEGGRYRSAFWTIYLLSAVATAFAVTPMALGWASESHHSDSLTNLAGFGEVTVIALVGFLYWWGHKSDWQGKWLANRTKAELAWYLPMVAPFVDFETAPPEKSWYGAIYADDKNFYSVTELDQFCRDHFALCKNTLGHIWADPEFVSSYGKWAASILEGQVYYHQNNYIKHHHLLHRVHLINNALFLLTAIGATAHLFYHAGWLNIVTAVFPALGAALHGALAQSESYRLASTSQQLAMELSRESSALNAVLTGEFDIANAAIVKSSTKRALTTILNEHEDWHMLIHPHGLPLG